MSARMDRLEAVLLVVLVVAVTGLGLVTWRADQEARDASRELACIERAQTTASIALLTPRANVDDQGRLDAIKVLGQQLENC
jgi:hypothetical protein